MSIFESLEVTCPVCAGTTSATVCRSLNVDLNPEARAALFDGTLNGFVCRTCGHQAHLPVPLLYHDMSRMFCVWYHPPASLDAPDFYEQFGTDGTQLMPAFDEGEIAGDVDLAYMTRPHIVFDMAELARYVYFRDQLHAHARRKSIGP